MSITIVRQRKPRIHVVRTQVPQDLWNLHAHSRYSFNDAMPAPEAMVERVKKMGQPAIGLTDHGNMPGTVRLYKAAVREGIKPFPGSELYVVRDREAHAAASKKRVEQRTDAEKRDAKRFHMCVAAFTTEGYRNLVRLSTMSALNFYGKPVVDLRDLTELGETNLLRGVAATSGCYFGMPVQLLVAGEEAGAQAMLATMAGAFDRFYVELQNHDITHDDGHWTDDLVADAMLGLAQKMGLPCVLTQDSHYLDLNDKDDHESLKRLVSFGPDADDAVFPGDGFHLADSRWFLDHHEGERLRAGREGLADLLAAHDLSIPALDKYSYNIPLTVADPDQDLTKYCFEQLAALRASGQKLGPRYDDRLLDELEIVKATGMAGYLVLVGECTDWLRDNEVFYAARGSASGSLICYLRGITQLDPIRWGLDFSRFISRDRTKPPDVDLDIEHSRRQEFIEWLRSRFSVHQIGTWTKYSISGEDSDEDGQKGSLRVRYFARRAAQELPHLDWNDVPAAEKTKLQRLSDRKLLSHYGVHPAGLVLTTTEDELRDLVPLMQVASSKTLVTQYDMKDIDALGLVKLDVLGLKTLTVLHLALDNLGRDYREGFGWIPLDDSPTYTMIGKGNTDGVFQLDGWSARYGCKDLKPTGIKDVIAAMALFRPATMSSGATNAFIARKHRKQAVPNRHAVITRHTKDTYGIMLFQEQVIAILRDLAMDPEDLTLFLKAVKSSNDNVEWARGIIDRFEPALRDEATRQGFTDTDWHWLWEAIKGFGEYGFNNAHATAYGIMAYRCAYLLRNHPVEYYAALLAVAAGESKKKGERQSKEQRYTAAARENGIRMLKPDVNLSGATYGVDPTGRGIRKGIVSIKGVGYRAANAIIDARAAGPFADLDDFAGRVDHRAVTGIQPYVTKGDAGVGIFAKLMEAGAFASLTEES